MTRVRLLLGALALALLGGAPAEAASLLEIRKVDTSRLPTVRVTVTAPPGDRAGGAVPFEVRENGRVLAPASLDVQRPTGRTAVALVIDTSHTMRGAPLAAALDAADDYLRRMDPADEAAVLTFGPTVQTVQPMTADPTRVAGSLRDIAIDPQQGTALNDGIAAGIRELASTPPTTRRVLIVLADGEDNASGTAVDALDAAALRDQVAVYAVAIRSKAYDVAALDGIAGRTGGSTFEAATADLRSAYRSIAEELSRTSVLSYSSTSADHVRLTVRQGDAAATSSYVAPPRGARSGGGGLVPERFTRAAWSAPVVALLVLVLLLAALLTILRPRPRTLVERLASYASAAVSSERDSSGPSISIFRHIAHSTERVLGELKFWKGIARLLQRADMPLRTAELFYLMIGAGLLAGLVATAFGLPLVLRLPPLLLGGALPLLVVARRARRRQRAFDDQLPDVLMTMASSMRAGHSFNQAMDVIIHEGSEPASGEFGRAAAEVRLGQAADAALDRMATRLDSKNFGFVVTAVNIQRQVGGSMAEILDSVADTVRARQQFLRKVKALTAMGRASAYVLVGMPFVLAALMAVLNASFMAPLFTTSMGHLMMAGALISISFGALILKKIVSFKV